MHFNLTAPQQRGTHARISRLSHIFRNNPRYPAPAWRLWAVAVCFACMAAAVARGQSADLNDKLLITARTASTWSSGTESIVQLEGPVQIRLGDSVLSADRAVIWLTPIPGGVLNTQQADISLLGNARIDQPLDSISRTGARLFVSAPVSGNIRVTAEQREARDLSDTNVYKRAAALRAGSDNALSDNSEGPAQNYTPLGGPIPSGQPTEGSLSDNPQPIRRTGPDISPASTSPIDISFKQGQTTKSPDGKVVLILNGDVAMMQRRPNGDIFELRAQNVVIYTPLTSMHELGSIGKVSRLQRVDAAYLEGDVRLDYTPAESLKPEQRLDANRVYYDFRNDRAILTDAVLHSLEPLRQIPIIVRANVIRQLSLGEYDAKNVVMTTSSFAKPSYSVNASEVYIHQVQVNDGPVESEYTAHNDVLQILGVPLFYWPVASGTIDGDPSPVRSIDIGNSNNLGFAIVGTFGLYELSGQKPPDDQDLTMTLGDYTERGPAIGFDGSYTGSQIIGEDKEPTSYDGSYHAFFIDDHGTDDLGGDRNDVTSPTRYRGDILLQHQQFFSDDWQGQFRLGWSSDPTFLEEWYQDQFDNNNQPHDLEAYLKHQSGQEAFTFLIQADTTPFVTTAAAQVNQFDVERLPEISYQTLGDSFDDDQLTFFSSSSASRLRFDTGDNNFADQGFYPGILPYGAPDQEAGIPNAGYTGTTDRATYRVDSRNEVDDPINLGQFKLVPFVMGRYTGYSQGPENDAPQRILGGAGLRLTTEFWKVDDTAESDLFDIHRLRHVIEPELDLFASGSTVDRSDVYVYDPLVDGVNDISGGEIALHQRWQTKRGGPGRWHSVDVFTLNVEGNFFTNQPKYGDLQEQGFRGLYFDSIPEASVARNSINADATWRVSDTTAVLADEEWNVDSRKLATASIGVAVNHDPRLTYFLGLRYVDPLNSDIASVLMNYQITNRYDLSVGQDYDFGQDQNVSSHLTLTRHFDRFSMSVTVFTDSIDNNSGFRFNLIPDGLNTKGQNASDVLNNAFSER